MREFTFELRLCAHLESDGHLVARQLGAGVRRPGNRIVDVLVVEPGSGFDDRRNITPAAIPHLAIEADVGVGRARSQRRAFGDLDVHPDTARSVAEHAIEIGFFERDRRGGTECIRQVARYPENWFDRLVAIENKPDLDRPGNLESQLRADVALGLVDEVVLATESYVTRAHLERLPEAVGVWRFDGDEIEVVRESTPLAVADWGIEIVAERPGRTDVRPVGAVEKARRRRRLAERAYGKGWRTFELPACTNARVVELSEVEGLPGCSYFDRLVDPAAECSAACPGFEAGEPPTVDLTEARDRTSPWAADAGGAVRRQSGLDRFG